MTEINQERLRCAHCGDVVGVYEPAVIVVNGVAHTTSLAAGPDLPRDGAHVYHHACSIGAAPDP